VKYAFLIAEDVNLGAGYVMSYLRSQGHEVKLFFDPLQWQRGYARNKILARLLDVSDANIRALKKWNPDAVCFSCVTATYRWGLKMAERVKREIGSKIIFGGVHATLVPEEVKRHKFIDDVCVGSGIEYFGGVFDPDTLHPDRASFFKELPSTHRKVQLFMTSFGCPFNCSFCGNEQLRKIGRLNIKRRKVDACIKELRDLKDTYGMEYVLFVDDIFTCDKKWLLDFLPKYSDVINLPFACFIHAKFVDQEIASALKKAKCHTAWMGIQTGYEQLRRDILHRNETNDEIKAAAKLVKDAGIKLMVDHIFGIPFESAMTQDLSLLLYNEIKPDVLNCYELLYFPKAKIIEHAVRFGYLATTDAAKINRGEGVVYQQNNKGHYFFDTYSKTFVALPLGNILFELLPMALLKLIIHIKAGRGFMPLVMIQNELFFTWRAVLKKLGLYGLHS